MTGRLCWYALGCVLLASCSPAAKPDPAPFSVGQAQRLSVRMESEASGASALAPGASNKRYGLTATAVLLPLAVSEGATRIRLQLEKVELQAPNADEQAALAQVAPLLDEPVVFTLRDGVAEDLRMSRQMQLQAYGWLRTVVSALQWPERMPPGSMQIEEEDSTGRYQARVEQAGESLRKVKTGYVKLAAQGVGAASVSMMPKIVRSEHMRSPMRGPLERVTVEETLRTALSEGKDLDVTTRVWLTALPDEGAAPLTTAELQKQEQALAGLAPFTPPTPREGTFDAQRIADASLDTVLQEIEQLKPAAEGGKGDDAQPDTTGAYLQRFSLIAAMLRQRPADVQRVGELIRSGHASTPMLMQALASAGTEQTQVLLRQFATEEGLSDKARSLAATSLLRVKLPVEPTLELLTQWANDPQREEHGLYGLGTAARHLRERGQHERAAAIAELLGTLLREAKEPGRTERVLRGIANSADARLFDQVRARASDNHAGIRTAVLDALRFMDHPRVDGLLLERARVEDDTAALRALLSTISARKPSKELAQAIAELAAGRQRYGVRFAAVEQAGKWLNERPELRALLEKARTSDEREEVQALAQGLLKPAKETP
jgi:hypothetical protein